jgi:hypothetical protein
VKDAVVAAVAVAVAAVGDVAAAAVACGADDPVVQSEERSRVKYLKAAGDWPAAAAAVAGKTVTCNDQLSEPKNTTLLTRMPPWWCRDAGYPYCLDLRPVMSKRWPV